MIWELLIVALCVFIICDCVENCVESKHKWNEFNGFGNCDGCPYDDENADCVTLKGETLMIKDTLDLINRQKAEIERLQKAIKVQDIMIEQQDYKLKQAKSEAIKEFAERLKAEVSHIPAWGAVATKKIDNLVKEMTEQSVNYGSSKTEGK